MAGKSVLKQIGANFQQTQWLPEYVDFGRFFDPDTGANPGDKDMKLNDATLSSVTKLYFNELDAQVESALFGTIAEGTVIKLTALNSTLRGGIYTSTGPAVLAGGVYTVNVTFNTAGSEGNFLSGEGVGITIFQPAATQQPIFVPASYIHDVATADADPGAGNQRFNNLTYASITEMYVDQFSSNGNDLSMLYTDVLKVGDLIYVQQGDDATKFVFLEINSAIIDASGYFKIPVTFIDEGAGGNIDDTAEVGVIFYRSDNPNPIVDNITVNGQSIHPINTLVDAATIATNCNLGNIHTVTLGGNRTLGAPTELQQSTYTWIIKQDGAPPRTLAYNAVFKWPGGSAPVLSVTANAVDIITGVSDGTVLYMSISKDVK